MNAKQAKKIRKEIRKAISESDMKNYLEELEAENRGLKNQIDTMQKSEVDSIVEEIPGNLVED